MCIIKSDFIIVDLLLTNYIIVAKIAKYSDTLYYTFDS